MNSELLNTLTKRAADATAVANDIKSLSSVIFYDARYRLDKLGGGEWLESELLLQVLKRGIAELIRDKEAELENLLGIVKPACPNIEPVEVEAEQTPENAGPD